MSNVDTNNLHSIGSVDKINNKEEKSKPFLLAKSTRKVVDTLFEQERKSFLDYIRKDNPEREKELVERFGVVRLSSLRNSLDFIQNNSVVNHLFSKDTPLIVTPEELVFLEEEDKLQSRFFVDFTLFEFSIDSKSFSPRWCRIPFQTNSQVKRTLEWIYNTNQKVENLSIINENDLDRDVNCLMEDGSYKHYPLRVVRYSERYDFKFDWKHKIELSHNISIKVVTESTEVVTQ